MKDSLQYFVNSILTGEKSAIKPVSSEECDGLFHVKLESKSLLFCTKMMHRVGIWCNSKGYYLNMTVPDGSEYPIKAYGVMKKSDAQDFLNSVDVLGTVFKVSKDDAEYISIIITSFDEGYAIYVNGKSSSITKCQERKYNVSLLTDYMELDRYIDTNSPEEALIQWFKYFIKRPTMANISCGTKEDCYALYNTFLSLQDIFYKEVWEKNQGKLLKFDYVVKSCEDGIKEEARGFLGKPDFFDSVHPFCLG